MDPETTDRTLIDLLERAAPTAAIPDALQDLAVGVLPTRRLRWHIAAAVAVPAMLLLGATTASAVATWSEWAWWADTADERTFDGETCRFWYQAEPIGIGTDDPAMVEARRVLSGLDLDALERSDAYVEELHRVESEPEIRDAVERGLTPSWSPRAMALSLVVNAELRAAVAAAGYDPDTVGARSALLDCEAG